MEIFLRRVGFAIKSPKRPSLQRVIEAAPDLIVVDWEPGEEASNTKLIEEIRSCSATSAIPILVSASETVSQKVKGAARLVVLHIPSDTDAVIGAMKLLGFTTLEEELAKDDERTIQKWSENQGQSSAEADIERICTRLPLVIRQLQQRYKGRGSLTITDEYDLQDLMHSLLRLFFDDVRAEEYVPSYAGAASRIDFLLKGQSCAIETKMTREGLGAREVGEQLIIDIARYRGHPSCKKLYCLVYDPEHRIDNPRGLENDLSGIRDTMTVRVMVVPKGT